MSIGIIYKNLFNLAKLIFQKMNKLQLRLREYEIQTIKQVVNEYDADAFIYLYGSRTDMNKKGGDIDLLVLSSKISFSDRIYIRMKLKDRLGDQKIDLLVQKAPDTVFARMALEEGVLL